MKTRFNVSKWSGVLGLLLITAFVRPIMGQDAKLIIVEKSDATRLKSAYMEFQNAKEKWEKLKTEVANEYTQGHPGWDKVEFSIDFRAMVQAPVFSRLGWSNVLTQITPAEGVIGMNGTHGPVGAIPYFTGTTGTVSSDNNTVNNSSLTFISPYGGSDLVTIRDGAAGTIYLDDNKTVEVKAKRVK